MTSKIAIRLTITAVALCPLAAQAQEPVEFHGFASQAYIYSHHNQYLAPDTPQGSLQYNETGLNAIKPLDDNLRVGIQLFARNLGDFGKNTVTVDWAYGDYRWRDWLGLRAGKLKLPLGLYNETRDIDSLRTNILLPQSVYDEATREVLIGAQGVGLYGNVPLRWLGALSYQLIGGTVTIPDSGSTVRTIETAVNDAFSLQPSSNVRVLVGQLAWDTPLSGLRLATSMIRGSWTMNGVTSALAAPLPAGRAATVAFNDYQLLIFSAEFVRRNLTLASEYMRSDATVNSTIDVTGLGMPVNSIVTSNSRKLDGFYVSAAYRFARWFEAGSYYSAYYNNRDDRDGALLQPTQPAYNGYQKDIALSLRFDVTDGWCVKVEGHRMFGAAQVAYDVTNTVKDWTVFAAKASFSF